MSHVATIDAQILDLDALSDAAQALGLELVRGQKTYRWYGNHVGDYPLPAGFTARELGTCEHAIRIPAGHPAWRRYGQPYEIGVVTRRDGKPGYTLLWDFFNRGYGLEDVVGADAIKLRQEYQVAVATKQLRKQGVKTITRIAVGDKIRLVATA